ncbi:RNA polymerase sigma-70 factor (ECF subfamily) [Chitinophaga skermanii]|uniref:RNA polymerase sigma-70 factor (ECF subfamily) n=1 Tax=Chitinophaga skermanii TaxID=331697 RepID=A0A327R377_9BACT|nr:RNA polymerase sigma-70 factor [Chitinophaga skermanii]RAJ11101.1 RNA polymerase sigma-70 factor (ECF subfamily) [Chitinophaga skermanii]
MDSDDLLHVTDDRLLTEIHQGNKAAFDILYNKYWKSVFNTAYKRLLNTELAQDVAQDVFVQVWTRAEAAPIENIGAYLHVAARNGVFKQLEKQSKYILVHTNFEEGDEPATTYGQADENMRFKEFMAAFKALTDSLPEQQRVIFNMRFHQGMTTQEIADELNISIKTVRNQIGKALQKVRHALMCIHILFILHHLD